MENMFYVMIHFILFQHDDPGGNINTNFISAILPVLQSVHI